MVVALLVAALIADIALSIIVYIIFKEVEELREHEQGTRLELIDLAEKTALKTAINSVYGLTSAKFDNKFDDLEKRLKAEHKYFEIKYSGILGNINNLWTHMDATEKVVLSLSEKASNTDTSEHKMKEPHYRYRHHYTYNSKPVHPIPDMPEDKEEINENDSNAGSKEEQNTESASVTIEQIKDDDIPTFNDPSSIQK